MSVEGARPREDMDADRGASTSASAEPEVVVPVGRDGADGISDLTYQILTPVLSHPTLRRGLKIVLIVLAGVCVLAALVRLSPLPLIALPVPAVGAYAWRRMRAVRDNDRLLLIWSCVAAGAVLFTLWLFSAIPRWMR